MAAITTFVSALIAFLFISFPFCSEAKYSGFSIDLIHRDSLKSPFYNPNETVYERIAKACERSITRVLRLSQDAHLDSAQTEITKDGDYLMKFSLGSPRIEIQATADTGSDLIWTQCKPCQHCYTQVAPLFDPTRSYTYKNVACASPQCKLLGNKASCDKSDSSCQYSITYADKSYTKGNLAVDTITLGSTDSRPMMFRNTIVGCGHNNDGTFSKMGSGTVGLGNGPLSLISQLGNSIDGKFSYCLVPSSFQGKKTSKLNFGTNAVVSGTGAVTTPLTKGKSQTLYYVNIKAISVADKRIPYSIKSPPETLGGNIAVDSGTTLTFLPTYIFSKFESAVEAAVVGKKVKSPLPSLHLCYEASSGLKLPKITVHFDGADVELKTVNTFIQVSNSITCLVFRGTNGLAVYGNRAQSNFLVGYDKKAGKLSFKPADCSKA